MKYGPDVGFVIVDAIIVYPIFAVNLYITMLTEVALNWLNNQIDKTDIILNYGSKRLAWFLFLSYCL